MKYRITGVSVPFGGVSWEKCVSEKDRIEYLFLYLESKRILTNHISMELPSQCIDSVLEIKNVLVQVTQDISFSEASIDSIRHMIFSCNQYLDTLNKLNLPRIIYKEQDRWEDLNFDSAMKAFRNSFREDIIRLEHSSRVKSHLHIPERW